MCESKLNEVVKVADKVLCITPQAYLQDVYKVPELPEVVRHGLEGHVSWHVRNEVTIERCINLPNLAPQFIAALLAGRAEVELQDGEVLLLADLLQKAGHFEIKNVTLALAAEGRSWGEESVRVSPSIEPIVSVAASVDVKDGVIVDARVALTGVWREFVALSKSVEVLVGQSLDEAEIEKVALMIGEEVSPQANFLGSVEYRCAMANVLTKNALQTCLKGVK
jgi:CO/xanthine dehydrogenase FAD-binding subunit